MKNPDIAGKIRLALELHDRRGEELKADPDISSRLSDLIRKIEASATASVSTGVSEICMTCDRDEGGSCCGAGIEKHYTSELLLINLLLGAKLPLQRNTPKSCLFLGERGCSLPARDILCINYLCLRLQKALSRENLATLQAVNGEEMDTLFLLIDRVRRFLTGC